MADAFCPPKFVSSEAIDQLRDRLLNPQLPIERRYRSLFSLRNLHGEAPREALIAALYDPSCLLAHEAAFALGQMQDPLAIPELIKILMDDAFHPMLRHEAAEALGAIGGGECISVLKSKLQDSIPEVRETCHLALRRIEESVHAEDDQAELAKKSITVNKYGIDLNDDEKKNLDEKKVLEEEIFLEEKKFSEEKKIFFSVDPARPSQEILSTDDLKKILLDEEEDMYKRYSALFALRNKGDEKSTHAIISSLKSKSALLKHEVAYVLGQLQTKLATQTLSSILGSENENPMVRHEAAEALGSIADEECIELLKKFSLDSEPIVSQSCQVALDMMKFEMENQFQYADVDLPN